jgi:hypothetical protein
MRKTYPTDLSDQEWACLKTHLPASKPLEVGCVPTFSTRYLRWHLLHLEKRLSLAALTPRLSSLAHRLLSLQKFRLGGVWHLVFKAFHSAQRKRMGKDPRRLRGLNRCPERQDNRGGCEIKRLRCPQEYQGLQATPSGGHLGSSALGLRYTRKRPRPRRSALPFGRPIGSLLQLVGSRALMVAEVFRYDQTLPRKSGSRPTRGLR